MTMASKLPFLILPAELRNKIYEYAAVEDLPLHLKAAAFAPSKHCIKSRSGLISTSQQVAAEYYAVLLRSALAPGARICVVIKDYDLRTVIAFVRTVVATTDTNPFTQILFVINITITNFDDSSLRSFDRWLSFCDNHTIASAYMVQNIDAAIGVRQRIERMTHVPEAKGGVVEAKRMLAGISLFDSQAAVKVLEERLSELEAKVRSLKRRV